MIAPLLLLVALDVAEPPRARVDATYPALHGARLAVAPGASLQAALDRARPGDEIVLEAGAVYRGPFRLPRKNGDGWIVVRTSAASRLPAPGTRVGIADARRMPKLEASGGSVISADPGAHHFRFVGLEIRPAAGVFLYNLVLLGSDETSLEQQPHHLVFDRCYVHGDPAKGARRGIALGSRDTAVVDSWISEIKEVGADSQAIAGWNGAGPYLLQNNMLEAAGENVMFGGADPRVPGLVPADIEIRRNHMRKPLRWKADEPRFEGTPWSTKNLFELKNARRVRVAGNVFEHNWVNAQNGFAILFTVRNQDGRAPWSTVEDVSFESNVVKKSAAGINVLGRDDNAPSGPAARIAIRNNLFEDVGGPRWGKGASGRLFQLLQAPADVVIEHNSGFHSGPMLIFDGPPLRGFVFRDNLAVHNGEAVVRPASFPGGVFRNNAIVGGGPGAYPEDNLFPRALAAVGFADLSGGDYRLRAGSAYRGGASDGRDIGVDFDALGRALGPSDEPAAVASTSRAAEALLWLSLLLLAYANVGYPLVLAGWAALRPRPFRTGPELPRLTILIAAHDEEAALASRLNNLLTLDYPQARLEILVGTDGCGDASAERARAYTAAGVRVVEFPERRGKPSVLNALCALADSDVLVFADARQRFEEGALRALAAPFADPEVGAVSGELLLADGEGRPLERGLGLYWRCEKAIRRSESRVGSTVGATGAIYAVRRRLFEPFPPDTILDDVWLPMRIARAGYRVVFEPGARAWDRAPRAAAVEFARKVRTISGGFQLFAREPWLLGAGNPLWLQTVSHKALRLLTPMLMLLALGANLLLLRAPFYRALLFLQLGFYAAALLGHLLRGVRLPGLSVPYAVCLLAWATVVAFVRFLSGRYSVTWARPARRPA